MPFVHDLAQAAQEDVEFRRRLAGARVSGQFHWTLGVAPILGRALQEDEDSPGSHRVAVISHGLWQREFGADPATLGRIIQLNNEPYQIVGVMPPSFHDFFNRRVEIWAPLALAPEAFSDDRRTNEYLALIARLKPGIDAARAQREMTAFAEQRGHSLVELAFSWLAAQPVVSSVIAGATRPEQVAANVKAADWALSAEDLAEIDTITA